MKNRICLLHIFGFVLSLLIPLGAVAQKSAKVTEADFFGTIQDGEYRNNFFGFTFKPPSGWQKFETEEVAAAQKIGTDALMSDNARVNRALEQATKAETVIVALGKKPLGAIENSAIAFGVLKQPSVHITAKMVAEASKSILIKNPANRLVRDVQAETISGKKFAVFDIELGMYGQRVPLRYYVTMVAGYSITTSMSYSDQSSLEVMESTFRTIKFIK